MSNDLVCVVYSAHRSGPSANINAVLHASPKLLVVATGSKFMLWVTSEGIPKRLPLMDLRSHKASPELVILKSR